MQPLIDGWTEALNDCEQHVDKVCFYVAFQTWFDGGSIITLKHKFKDLWLRLTSYKQFDGCVTRL